MARAIPKNSEVKIENYEIFFSTTDPKGVIRSGNDVFVRLSGHPKSTLVGAPHNIIRHPDMPKAVFRLLWDTIGQNKTCVAYVKNLAADGSYYWVLANVFPIPGGYLSIRVKPTSKIFGIAKDLYPKMLEAEKAGGMDKAAGVLMDALKSVGLEDYFQFMVLALAEELKSRDELLKDSDHDKTAAKFQAGLSGDEARFVETLNQGSRLCVSVKGQYGRIFSKLDGFASLEKTLTAKTQYIIKLAEQLKLMSINASVESTRCGSFGPLLAVVASSMQSSSDEAEKSVREIDGKTKLVMKEVRGMQFTIAVSKLQIETIHLFLKELIDRNGSPEAYAALAEDSKQINEDVRNLVDILNKTTTQSLNEVNAMLVQFNEYENAIKRLEDIILSIEVTRRTGILEAARAGDQGKGFLALFQQMDNAVNSARNELRDFRQSVTNARDEARMISTELTGSKALEQMDALAKKLMA